MLARRLALYNIDRIAMHTLSRRLEEQRRSGLKAMIPRRQTGPLGDLAGRKLRLLDTKELVKSLGS